MPIEYIRKTWELPTEQSGTRNLGTGLYSPVLSAINNLELTVSDKEFYQLLSSVELGGKIAYPDEYHKLSSILLESVFNSNSPQYLSDGVYYPPYAEFIDWHPVTPYDTTLNQKPFPQMTYPAWNVYNFELPEIIDDFLTLFGFSLETFTGYKTGDALSFVLNMNSGSLLDTIETWLFDGDTSNVLKTGFDIHVNGSGTLAIELLNVPLGGRVIYEIDEEPNLSDMLLGIFQDDDDLIETDKDITSLPPETDTENVEEITITGEGNHIVYVRLLPVLNDQILPIAWGAGLRSIRLGTGLKPVNPETGEIIDAGNISTTTNNLGIMTMTYQDLFDALDAHETRKAMRYLLASDTSNIKNDVEIDASDMTSKIKLSSGTTQVVLPSDIPSDDIVYGGGYEVGIGFQTLVSEIILRRDTQARTAQNVADILRYSYIMRGIVDTVDYLLTALGTPFTDATDTVTPTVNPVDIANLVYCHGANKQTLYRYAQDIEDANSTDAQHIADWYRLLIAEIEQEQIDNWYSVGTQSPRLGYDSADCYRVAPITKTITYDMPIWNVNLDNVWTGLPLNHLWRISVKCLTPFVDATGNSFDGVYYVPDAGNIAMYAPILASGVYGFNYVEPFGGQQDIGTVYSAEISRATVAPRSLRYTLTNTWTAGKIEMTLIDLGVLS